MLVSYLNFLSYFGGVPYTLGAGGVLLLVLHSGLNGKQDMSHMLGNLLLMVNSISYGAFLILAIPMMKKYHVYQVMTWTFLSGLIVVLPFGFLPLMHTHWELFSTLHWTAFIFVILGATFFAYLLNTLGLKYANVSTVSIYIYNQPIIGALIAIWWGGSVLDTTKVICMLMIFAGVYLVTRKIPSEYSILKPNFWLKTRTLIVGISKKVNPKP